MTKYAATTDVPAEKSRAEIEATLRRYDGDAPGWRSVVRRVLAYQRAAGERGQAPRQAACGKAVGACGVTTACGCGVMCEMKEYHKINTIFKRDMSSPKKTIIVGDYSMPEFEYLAANEWIFTEKVDGTNIRVMVDSDGVSFGGKTDNAQIPAHLVKVLNDTFLPQIDLLREVFPSGACLYGEGYGAKIQKGGGNYRSDQGFVLFDVKVGDWWLERPSVEDIGYRLNIDFVPIIGSGSLNEAVDLVRGDRFLSHWGNFQAEGVVARPAIELKTRSGHRIITKIKAKDFA